MDHKIKSKNKELKIGRKR